MINWGIIGAGNIAHQFATDFKYVTNGKILGIASRILSRAQDFSKTHQIERSYGNYIDLVSDNDIDVIYIATPHVFHKEHALLALKHNKHVLCEKPFAINQKEGKELFDFAKKKGLFLMEGMWMLFQPTIKKVKEWILEDEIGDIKAIQASFGFSAPFNPENRLFNKFLGGGSLLDVGIYPLALAQSLIPDNPSHITALGTIGETEVDEQISVIMSHKNNKIVSFSSSIICDYPDDAFIYGTKGYIHIPNFWYSKKAYLIKDNNTYEFTRETPAYGYAFEAQHVNQMIHQGRIISSQIPPIKTLQVLKIMDKIRDIIGLKYPVERK